jgi:hypothetical protein
VLGGNSCVVNCIRPGVVRGSAGGEKRKENSPC